jgi:hypothetical protein
MSLPDGAAAVFASATRVFPLDANGYVDAGATGYVSDALIKATLQPTTESGDDIALKGASGNLVVMAKHGDMVKYGSVTLDFATPDPQLEAILAGGTVYTASNTALGLVTGLTATPQTTLGSLAAGTFGYRATQYNAYGETAATSEVPAVVASGTAGTVVLSGAVMAAGALGVRIYGRTIGGEKLLGQYVNIGTQATSAVSGTGAVATLTVTALTQPVPAGYTFQIAGDTNSPKIVFTTTQYGAVGSTTLFVTPSQSVTTTIAAGNLVPVFVDAGTLSPTTAYPTVDTTAGPGAVGYQSPTVGPVANPYGVSLEFFEYAYFQGYQVSTLPFYRILLPKVANMVRDSADVANANFQTMLKGQAFQNPNWGSGPYGDFPFDSSRWMQRVRCGAAIVPAVTTSGVPLPVVAPYTS